jgi:PAS domain S-box-containing protein
VSEAACIIQDITDRKKADEDLRKSESTLRSVISASPVGIVFNTPDRHIVWVNQVMGDICGYTTDELRSQSARILYETDEEFSRVREAVYGSAQPGDGKEIATRWKRKDGETRDVQLNVAWLDRDEMSYGYVFIAADITDRKQAEEKIRASLKEKEVLLKEIHHRVKNNLQIISSLLFLQASGTEHPGAVSALQESRARVKSMALIHERLYQSPDLAAIDMGEYTRNLVSDLQHSYRTEDGLVRFTLNLEAIPLGITEAIPCGLIINELVSNALKHAFPKGREGEITVQLLRGNTNQIALSVSDNGIGFPEHVDFRKSPSLGLTLVNSLVDQLHGAIELDRRRGTAFRITFG